MMLPNWIVRNCFEPGWDLYEGSIRLKSLRFLRESQWWAPDKYEEHQNGKLQLLIQHAYESCQYYRSKFDEFGISPNSICSPADLQIFPVLHKEDVRKEVKKMVSTRYPIETLQIAKTGGSTGVPLAVYVDKKCVELRNAAAIRANEWSGWSLGEPIAAIWGNPPGKGSIRNRIRNTLKDRYIYLDTMRLNEKSVEAFLREWRHTQPGLLYGHAHSLFLLAEYLLDLGENLVVNGIVSTSMMLLDSERKVIEKAFGVSVTNRYGCEEVSLIGCECELHCGMHLNSEYKIVEFLNEDGQPCMPGENGRIVVTDLTNFSMPMIRYEVGDWGVPSNRTCPCGRGAPLMEALTGRVADFLVASDGSKVAGISLIENSLTKYRGIKQMQLIQDKRFHLKIKIVATSGYSREIERQLGDEFRQHLGDCFEVHFELVPQIPQEISGKYRFSKCLL